MTIYWFVNLFSVQHVLLKPDVKGVEDDEDLPEDPV